MTTSTPTPTVKRAPIRGLLWGLIGGLGVALILVELAVIALGTLTPIVVIVVVGILGALWGSFGPARGPEAPPATGGRATVEPDETPVDPEPADAEGPGPGQPDAPDGSDVD